MLRQFNRGLNEWLSNPRDDALYRQLKTQLTLWSENRKNLEQILTRHPQWLSLAENSQRLAGMAMVLLDKRAKGKTLSANERESMEKTILQLRQIDQEIIIGLAASLEKILYSLI